MILSSYNAEATPQRALDCRSPPPDGHHIAENPVYSGRNLAESRCTVQSVNVDHQRDIAGPVPNGLIDRCAPECQKSPAPQTSVTQEHHPPLSAYERHSNPPELEGKDFVFIVNLPVLTGR